MMRPVVSTGNIRAVSSGDATRTLTGETTTNNNSPAVIKQENSAPGDATPRAANMIDSPSGIPPSTVDMKPPLDIKPDMVGMDPGEARPGSTGVGMEDMKGLKIPKSEQMNTPSAAEGKAISAPSSSTSSPCGTKDGFSNSQAPFSHPGMTPSTSEGDPNTSSSSMPDLSNDPSVPLSAMSALASGGGHNSVRSAAGGPPTPMSTSMPPSSPTQAQPLPSNVINKQPSTIDAPYMQQQSQIFVFSTLMANHAAEAVLKGQFVSIISFHCAQPGTKKVLEKYPLRVNQFNRPNPAEWLNQMANMKQQQQPYRGGPQSNTQGGPPPHPPVRARCTPPPGMQGPPPMGDPHQNPKMMNPQGGPGIGYGGPYGPPPGSVGGPPWGPNGPQMQPPYMGDGSGPPPGQQYGPPQPNAPPPPGAGPPMGQRLAQIPNVKVPDEVLTPQQRQHREEQLAALRKVTQMLQGPHQMNPNSPGGPDQPGMGGGNYNPSNSPGHGPPPPGGMGPRGLSPRFPHEGGPGGPMGSYPPHPPGPRYIMERPMGPGPGPQGPPMRNVISHGGPYPPWRPEVSQMGPMPPCSMAPNSMGGDDFSGMYNPPHGSPMGGPPQGMMSHGGHRPMGPGGPMGGYPPMDPNAPHGPPARMPLHAQLEWQKLQQQYYDEKRRQHQQSDPSSPLTPTSKGGPMGGMMMGMCPSSEPSLMPVPSPQQIQYLNAFDGQELTIQKQPNTSLNKDGEQMPLGSPMNSMQQQGKPPSSTGGEHRLSGGPMTPVSSAPYTPPSNHRGGSTPESQQPPPKYPGPSSSSVNPPTPKSQHGPHTPQTPSSQSHPHPYELSPAPPGASKPQENLVPYSKSVTSSSGGPPFDASCGMGSDPISSMAHMTQQLAGGPPSSQGGTMPTNGPGGPPNHMVGPPHPGGPQPQQGMPPHSMQPVTHSSNMMSMAQVNMGGPPHMHQGGPMGGGPPPWSQGGPPPGTFQTNFQQAGPSPLGVPPPHPGHYQPHMMGPGPGGPMIPHSNAGGPIMTRPHGGPTVNNTYVNATMAVQHMNVGHGPPHHHGPPGPPQHPGMMHQRHSGPQGGYGPPQHHGMMPYPPGQPGPPQGGHGPMPPMGIPPTSYGPGPFPPAGKRMRMMQPPITPASSMSDQMSVPIGPYSGGANVQVRPNAPNTIQYLPTRSTAPPTPIRSSAASHPPV